MECAQHEKRKLLRCMVLSLTSRTSRTKSVFQEKRETSFLTVFQQIFEVRAPDATPFEGYRRFRDAAHTHNCAQYALRIIHMIGMSLKKNKLGYLLKS